MRKYFVLGLALLFVFSLTSVAFAHSSGYVSFDGDSGWVSDGHHGHYWSGDFSDDRVAVDWDSYYEHVRDWDRYNHRYYDWESDRYHGWGSYYDNVDGDWYYYKDDNGVNRYYFDNNDDNDWKYHSYVDEYGNTQYSRTKVVKINK